MFIKKDEAGRVANLARWAYAQAAMVDSDPTVQRRLAWSVLAGALAGITGVDLKKDLLPESVKPNGPFSLDELMKKLADSLRTAFIDGPASGMFSGPDADEAWEEVLSRFIINSVRANVVILDRGRYDKLVKNQRRAIEATPTCKRCGEVEIHLIHRESGRMPSGRMAHPFVR